jgi:hypothetical protein
MHAWQALLMFVGGLFSIIGAFSGYITSGGAEELFHRALANLETGKANFDSLQFDWGSGEMVVRNLRHADFSLQDKTARFTGLAAKEVRVRMDLFPWPPQVKSIEVRGMADTAIAVSDDFLQKGTLNQLKAPEIPILFVDCNLRLTYGHLNPVQLSGCGGEMRRGPAGELRGAFSLREFNGKPFQFKLESLVDGRWVLTGEKIEINTRAVLAAAVNPFQGRFDPVFKLVGALFTGEMGAEGTVSLLRIVVQPATSAKRFSCDGEVGYQNLVLRLPPAEQQAGEAVPFFLWQLVGADETKGENPWPRWMQVDSIETGANGRVAFNMSEGVLNFACDEGPGSAFTGTKNAIRFPPLESFKGSVETDEDSRPRRVVLRGFFGDKLGFETRIQRGADLSRAYELIVQPRAGDSSRIEFNRPMWRFASRLKDHPNSQKAEFELEGNARRFPLPELLPPGMVDISGRMYAKGRMTGGKDNLTLSFDNITLDDGAKIVYGGQEQRGPAWLKTSFDPLWSTLEALFSTPTAWTLNELALQGRAEVRLGKNWSWQGTSLKEWKLVSGALSHAGLSTDLRLAGLQLDALHRQKENGAAEISISALVPDPSNPDKQPPAPLWDATLLGAWNAASETPSGAFTFTERNVPLALHPQRERLEAAHISADRRRVNRATEVAIKPDGSAQRYIKP